jgi:hypothetical protein
MKRSKTHFLASILALTILCGSAWACNPRCRPAGGTTRSAPPSNVIRQQIPPSPNGLGANDVIVNDLPADAKRAIRAAAAKVRTNPGVGQHARTTR